MGTRARKERKRAGIPHVKPPKTPTRPWSAEKPKGWGLTSTAEILTALYLLRR